MHDTTKNLSSQAIRELERFAGKRRSNDRVIGWMEKHLTESAHAAMKHCGDYLVFLEDESREHRKLEVGYFCKQRLCAGCAWREAVANAQCISAISQAMIEQGYIMLMVTLTVPNVPGAKLRKTMQHLSRSWLRLAKRERYAVWRDGVRKMEITYNSKTDTYHPHMHMVVYVKPSYFKGANYISRAQLLKDWRECTGQPEVTQVDVRRCRNQGSTNAVLEVSKYAAKASDYAHSEEVLDTFYAALHHSRLLTYFGKPKDLRTDYQCGRLAKYEETDTTRYTMRVTYIWQRLVDAAAKAADADRALQRDHAIAARKMPTKEWRYVEKSSEPYDMDAAELARLQRDERKLQAMAMEKAKRATELDELFRTSWVREFAKVDDADMEVVDD